MGIPIGIIRAASNVKMAPRASPKWLKLMEAAQPCTKKIESNDWAPSSLGGSTGPEKKYVLAKIISVKQDQYRNPALMKTH